MRASAFFIDTTVFSCLASAVDFTAPLQCLRMKDAAESLDTDRLARMWAESACKIKTCQPKLSDYKSSVRDACRPIYGSCI